VTTIILKLKKSIIF